MKERIASAVIDTSALICIALDEPAAKFFLDGFSRTERLFMGTATNAETWLAIYNLKGTDGAKMVEDLIDAFKVKTVVHDSRNVQQAHFR